MKLNLFPGLWEACMREPDSDMRWAARALLIALIIGVSTLVCAPLTVIAQNVGPIPTGAPYTGPAFTTNGAHVTYQGNPPVLTSCGTGPAIQGSDASFHIVPGTDATTCTITFAVAYSQRPTCVVAAETVAISYNVTVSAVTVTATAGASRIHGHCFARGGGS